MDSKVFQNYLENTQRLLGNGKFEDNSRQDVLKIIKEHMKNEQASKEGDFFLKGEEAFFNRQYKLSLKYYSMAHDIPNFRFFCHRATAYVFKNGGRLEKAIDFAQRALNIYPEDAITLGILEELLREKYKGWETEKIQNEIASLKEKALKEHLNKKQKNEEVNKEPFGRNPIPLAKKELDDLSNIFNEEDNLTESMPALNDSFLSQNDFWEKDFSEKLEDPFSNTLEDTPLTSMKTDSILEEISLKDPQSLDLDEENGHANASESLKNFMEDEWETEEESYSSFSASPPLETIPEMNLEKRVEQFQQHQSNLISLYVKEAQKRKESDRNFLCILNGWNYQRKRDFNIYDAHTKISNFLLPEYRQKTCGGIYLRWNGKGIVINPGMNFLENFHHQELHIKDIDYVIVTRNDTSAYSDIKGIYSINCQHNRISSSLHVIHYYLNQKAYENIAGFLKPCFKQERNTVHGLELYVDSPDLETLNISEGISLSYFHTSNSKKSKNRLPTLNEENNEAPLSCLGIRLTLENLQTAHSLSIGFSSGAPWSSQLTNNLKGCDIIISAFEKTNSDDYNKIKYNNDCLGYYGTYTLVKEIQPKILLCNEFSGREGDIRMEVVKKIREELTKQNIKTVVLPGDIGLYLELDTLAIQCSISKTFVDNKKTLVVKSSESFGNLQYLSPNCFI